MISRPKHPGHKACKSANVTPELKRKSLPHISGHLRTNSTTACKSPKCRGRTGSRPRSNSVNDFHKGNWAKIFISLRKSSKYKAYGRSSDTTYGDPSQRQYLDDPYQEISKSLDCSASMRADAPSWLLVAEARLQARRLQVKESVGHKTTLGGLRRKLDQDNVIKGQTELSSDCLPNGLTRDEISCSSTAAGDSDKNMGKNEVKGKEETEGGDENDNDLEDDDEEDESGLPQAVRATQHKSSTPTAKEILKERHKARMEEMANEIPADDLLDHLKEKGFFNYDYSRHARTNLTNHNLRIGKKKGIERLLVLLSFA